MHQHLPHLLSFHFRPIVFLTAATEARLPLLATHDAHKVLRDVWLQSAQLHGWYVGQYVIMPDHVHLFAWPDRDARSLPAWMRTWKSVSTMRINRMSDWSGGIWQADYGDRYLRSREEYAQKWDYVAANPVRAGLAGRAEEWPFSGTIWDLNFPVDR
jgi:putative transposase